MMHERVDRLIVGCGYLGRRVAVRWRAAGLSVGVTTRSRNTADEWRADGFEPFLVDVVDRSTLHRLPSADVVLYSVGYDARGLASRFDATVRGLVQTLAATKSRWRRVIYCSSTSVYGQEQGERVDEESACRPASASGVWAELAERAALALIDPYCRSIVLRLAGIYGPGRLLARTAALQSGTPLAGRPDAWLNLIHVDDAAEAVLKAAEYVGQRRRFLICDEQPMTRGDYYHALALKCGAPPPAFDPTQIPARGRGLNKRCDGSVSRNELKLTLRHPSAVHGLASCFDVPPSPINSTS